MGVERGSMWEDVCHSVIMADDCCGIDQMEKENFLQIEDILEFSNEDIAAPIGEDNSFDICSYKEVRKDPLSGSCSSSSSSTIKSNSSSDLNAVLQSSDLFVPEGDGLGELEWLSNLIEEEPPKWIQTPTHDDNVSHFVKTPAFNPENPVPGKARSKRSRTPAYNLSSRVVVSPESSSYENITMSSTVSSDSVDSSKATYTSKFDLIRYESDQNEDFGLRKCTHCLTTRTPQWRTGPKGPKTLCNACGVRFKSGRLVPEYRPASSPTFVPSKHSNSHRKVMEMRRHKHIALFQARSRPRSVAKQDKDVYSPEESGSEVFQYQWFDATDYEECLIPTKQDFRQLIL